MKKYSFGMMVLALALVAVAGFSPAQARLWKPTARTLAQDYGQIVDNSKKGELTVLFWFPSPMFDEAPAEKAMMEKYVVIGIVHASLGPGGMMPTHIDTLQVLDGNGKPLNFIPQDKLPPPMLNFLEAFGGSMSKSLGVVGTAMQYFVFDTGDVNACKKGGMSIPFNGETYTYETPIPGCPAP